jgi:(E)-4-hydroxy-3-methylbut-2-enyl-diphosphate synthase
MTIDLGMPQPAHEPLASRRKSRQIMVGKGKHAVPVGGGAPVSVQSMTTTLTADVNATLQQIAELTATGCQIVRVAVPSSGQAIGSITLPATGRSPILASASVLTGNTSSRRPQEPVARQTPAR